MKFVIWYIIYSIDDFERNKKVDRKEKVLGFISDKDYIPLKYDEIKTVLAVPSEDEDEFAAILDELLCEGKIFKTAKKRYELCKRANIIAGKLLCSAYSKYAFLIPDDENEEQVFIGPDGLNGAYDGDFVIVSVDKRATRTGKREGHVLDILKRGNTAVTGIIKFEKKDKYYLYPDSSKLYAKIVLDKNTTDAKVGDRVLAELVGYPEDGKISAILLKNLGDANELKSNIEAIISEHSIKSEFDEETLIEAQNAKKRVCSKDIDGRLDLRDKLIFTIDGDDARDFDDAVSVEITDDEKFLLGVHIADVTHYVRPNTALDSEAFSRGTSVYLADRVIPMLPFELSNGICSLNPKVLRLTLSVFMKIDKNGEVMLEGIYKSVIKSCERMTYNNVADLLEKPTDKLLKRYEYLLPTLENMYELSKILYKRREKRGSINFDFPESKVIVDDKGEPVDIVSVNRRISHKMIEEFMLIANETVAEAAFWAELPFVFRVHESPSADKTTEFNRFILNFGYSLKGKIDDDNPIHPKAFQTILEQIEGTPEHTLIATYMLRSLMKAEYSPQNLGHFGLAAKYYCHFTSPIRRYPDLFIHRVLKAYIDGKDTGIFESINTAAAQNSSQTEREAEYCERDVDDLLKAAYMSQFIGADFSATVSSVTNFGMFVQLENTVEGLIRLDTMNDDFYEYNDNLKQITGARTEKNYKIGDRIDVVLANCDILTRRIDFVRREDFHVGTISQLEKKKQSVDKRKSFSKRRKTNYSNRTKSKRNKRGKR